jgi:hypothetical protein
LRGHCFPPLVGLAELVHDGFDFLGNHVAFDRCRHAGGFGVIRGLLSNFELKRLIRGFGRYLDANAPVGGSIVSRALAVVAFAVLDIGLAVLAVGRVLRRCRAGALLATPTVSSAPPPPPAIAVLAIVAFALVVVVRCGFGFSAQQRLPVRDGDLIVDRLNFTEGEETMPVSAVFDKRRLKGRFYPGYPGEIDVSF